MVARWEFPMCQMVLQFHPCHVKALRLDAAGKESRRTSVPDVRHDLVRRITPHR
jgi:hypothetical protein